MSHITSSSPKSRPALNESAPCSFSTTDSNISRLLSAALLRFPSSCFLLQRSEEHFLKQSLPSALSLPITRRRRWHSPGNAALVKSHDAHQHSTGGLPSGEPAVRGSFVFAAGFPCHHRFLHNEQISARTSVAFLFFFFFALWSGLVSARHT